MKGLIDHINEQNRLLRQDLFNYLREIAKPTKYIPLTHVYGKCYVSSFRLLFEVLSVGVDSVGVFIEHTGFEDFSTNHLLYLKESEDTYPLKTTELLLSNSELTNLIYRIYEQLQNN